MLNIYRRFVVKDRWGNHINSYSCQENQEKAQERALNCAKHPCSKGDVWGEDFDGKLDIIWMYDEGD